MISYGNNSVMCRRKYLFKHFMIYDDIELGISKIVVMSLPKNVIVMIVVTAFCQVNLLLQ